MNPHHLPYLKSNNPPNRILHNPNNPLHQHPRLTQHVRMPRTAPHHRLRLRRRGKHLLELVVVVVVEGGGGEE